MAARNWHIFMLLLVSIAVHASNNEQMSTITSMEDLRQLDTYGESVAIRHATAAADRGSPVAVLTTDECIYICSVKESLLKTIDPKCRLIATGIQGDASLLCRELQSHSSTIRHRFGTVHKWEQRSIPYLFRRCFHYDEAKAWNPPVIDAIEHDKERYSRPLGIRAVIVQYDEDGIWTAQSVDPSGALQTVKGCFVMGRDAQTIKDRIERRNDNDSIETTLQKAFDGRTLYLDILHKNGSVEHTTL